MDYDHQALQAVIDEDLSEFSRALFHRSYSRCSDYDQPLEYQKVIQSIRDQSIIAQEQFTLFLNSLYEHMRDLWASPALFYFQVGDHPDDEIDEITEEAYYHYRKFLPFQSLTPEC